MDGDSQPDSGTTGNENGGRVSYIHYAEPFPTMVDLSHVGYSDEPVHLVTAAVEVLSTNVGTGIIYLIDTTDYTMVDGQLKFNPLALWSRQSVLDYAEQHNLPAHPLVAQGFPSIGCWPCTKPVDAADDPRAGRWQGADKTECGIHQI